MTFPVSRYVDEPCVFVFEAVGLFSEILTDTTCQDFSLWIWVFFYLSDMKHVLLKSLFFPELACCFISFLICVICLLHAS